MTQSHSQSGGRESPTGDNGKLGREDLGKRSDHAKTIPSDETDRGADMENGADTEGEGATKRGG
jgi:hypothetical protein